MSIKNLSVFIFFTKIIENVSFNIEENQILGILGRNGSGKSTIVKAIFGLVPYFGEIRIFIEKEKISYVPQENILVENFTVLENFKFFCKNIDYDMMNYLIDYFGLEKYLNKKVKELSGGWKRITNFCIGLLNKPKLLFLDEPTANLDIDKIDKIIDFLKEYKKHASIVLITHNEDEVEKLCDRIIVIEQGKKILEGTLEEIKNLLNVGYKVYLDDGNSIFCRNINEVKNYNIKWIEKIGILKRIQEINNDR